MITPAEVLNKAADLLEERGWFRGYQGKASCLCANLALGEAADVRGNMHGEGYAARYRAYQEAQTALLKHLDLKHYPDYPMGGVIVVWNDATGRTQGEVVAALRAAGKAIA